MQTINSKTFPLGTILVTQGANAFLAHYQVSAEEYCKRHASGDWGELDPLDKQSNEEALEVGGRILSSYSIGKDKLWVITEADRSYTTLLLPSEY